jgi:predicted nucleotidyltransferase
MMSPKGAKKMRIDDAVKKNRLEILRIAVRYGGKNVRLFGSIARGTATESSDREEVCLTR